LGHEDCSIGLIVRGAGILLSLVLVTSPASAKGWMPGLFSHRPSTTLTAPQKPRRVLKRLAMRVEKAGDKVADRIAGFGGSRAYMIGLLTALTSWVLGNTVGGLHIDPQPFVLANLGVSILTSMQGFFVLKSQEHQRHKDRQMRDLAFDHLDDGLDHVSEGLRTNGLAIKHDGRAAAFKDTTKLSVEDKIARFSGSWKFFASYLTLTATWLVLNKLPGLEHFDPSPFFGLNTANTLFAVFQGLFVLRAQDRMDREDREHLKARIGHLEEKIHEQAETLRSNQLTLPPSGSEQQSLSN
jgi:uncharacterized membrane protein